MLLVDQLNEGTRLPRNVPVEKLRRLLGEIQSEATAYHANKRRMGLLDCAWFLLMLHGGLHTCEVRRLKPNDVDWEGRKVRIEQSKGLKDRYVFTSASPLSMPCRLTWRSADRPQLFLKNYSSIATSP